MGKQDWQTLRQKKAKNAQILELQSALQGELQKRNELEQESMETRTKLEEAENDLVQARSTIQELQQNTYHLVIFEKKSLCLNFYSEFISSKLKIYISMKRPSYMLHSIQ